MSDEQPPLALGQAIVDAIASGPLTKAELCHRLAVTNLVLNGCICGLAKGRRVMVAGDRVGLPGTLDDSEPITVEEEERERFRELWRRRGIVAIDPTDIPDDFVRERLCLFAIQLYGRRR
jgi:hypothetical protein